MQKNNFKINTRPLPKTVTFEHKINAKKVNCLAAEKGNGEENGAFLAASFIGEDRRCEASVSSTFPRSYIKLKTMFPSAVLCTKAQFVSARTTSGGVIMRDMLQLCRAALNVCDPTSFFLAPSDQGERTFLLLTPINSCRSSSIKDHLIKIQKLLGVTLQVTETHKVDVHSLPSSILLKGFFFRTIHFLLSHGWIHVGDFGTTGETRPSLTFCDSSCLNLEKSFGPCQANVIIPGFCLGIEDFEIVKNPKECSLVNVFMTFYITTRAMKILRVLENIQLPKLTEDRFVYCLPKQTKAKLLSISNVPIKTSGELQTINDFITYWKLQHGYLLPPRFCSLFASISFRHVILSYPLSLVWKEQWIILPQMTKQITDQTLQTVCKCLQHSVIDNNEPNLFKHPVEFIGIQGDSEKILFPVHDKIGQSNETHSHPESEDELLQNTMLHTDTKKVKKKRLPVYSDRTRRVKQTQLHFKTIS